MSRLSIPVLDADGHVTESYQQICLLYTSDAADE